MDPNLQQNVQLQQQQNALAETFKELLKDQQDLIRQINNELKNQTNVSKEVRKQYSALESIGEKLLDNEEDLLDLSQRQLEKEEYKAKKALERLHLAHQQLQSEIAQGIKSKEALEGKKKLTTQERILLAAAEEGFKHEQELVDLVEYRLNLQKRINKDIGLYGATIKSIENLTKKIGLSGIDDVFKEARKAAEQKAKSLIQANNSVSSVKVNLAAAGASMNVLAKGIGQALMDPMFLITAQIALLKKGFDLYKGINQEITEQGRQLGISYEESRKIYNSAVDYSLAQKDIYATENRITEGRKILNEALGTSLAFSNEINLEAKKLAQFYGLSAEQQQQMMMNSAKTGKNITQTKNEILKTAVIQKAQYGGTLSYQKIMQKVNSVSGEILTKFKGNIPALTATVQQADRLGLSLEQVDKIGESLLNWESSIEAELKAELLTGKAINLEKARAAALSGDQAKLMNEIVSQVGDIHKFESMNVLQRKAYAEAFGMTSSEMGDMLRKQKFETEYGKISRENAQSILDTAKARGATIDDTIKKELEQLSLQERISDVITRIQSLLKRITEGPFKTLGKIIEKVLSGVEKIMKVFSSMTGGALGDALGAVLLGAPMILLAMRGLVGLGRSLILGPRGTDLNPMVVRMQGMGGGFTPMTAGQRSAYFSPMVNPMAGTGAKVPPRQTMGAFQYYGGGVATKSGGGFSAFSPKAMGVGMGLGIGGMALNTVAEGMEPGGAKSAMGVAGTTATFAGMGATFGPYGAAIGGLIGLGVGLFNLATENEERRKQEAEQLKRDNQKYNEMLRQFSIKPTELRMNNETVAIWNTHSQVNSSYARRYS